jgi:hypothetical protein
MRRTVTPVLVVAAASVALLGCRPQPAGHDQLFGLRGGGDREAAAKGFWPDVPRARLAVLPGTSHIGLLARSQLIVDVVTPFLDDEKPPLPDDFLQPGPGKTPASASQKKH